VIPLPIEVLRQTNMSIVLKHQVEASERSVTELEAELGRQHGSAMLCYDVQDLMRTAVNLHGTINRGVERWQDDLSTGRPDLRQETEHLGPEWFALYQRLAAVFEKTAGLLRSVEKAGFVPDGKAEFSAAWRELRGIVCFDYDRVAAAFEQIRRGEVRPLEDVKRELWDRP
jgi:hypothetical protein